MWSVSYTHLDVYKRQKPDNQRMGGIGRNINESLEFLELEAIGHSC